MQQAKAGNGLEKKSLTRKVARSGDTRGLKHAAVHNGSQRCKSCLWETPQLPKDNKSTDRNKQTQSRLDYSSMDHQRTAKSSWKFRLERDDGAQMQFRCLRAFTSQKRQIKAKKKKTSKILATQIQNSHTISYILKHNTY